MSNTVVCLIHNVPETWHERTSFKACGECWHVWQTETEFRADLAEWYGRDKAAVMDLDMVWSCPLCIHDF